ncbi:MAG TPA: hypothetical protein VNT20_21650 [Flavisolibacter sp.]|nr:hypothetical protein [Flavisolibacter sp.]
MNHKLICSGLLLLATVAAFSQQDETDVTNVTKVTIINPGLSYEARIGKFQTLYMQGFMSMSGYFSYSDALGTESAFYFDPAADIQYRYYYNGRKRFEMEKRTEMNSMNYVTVMSEFILSKMRLTTDYIDESKRRAISRFGVGWGFQRNYAQHFSLDLNLGLGYLLSKGTSYNWNGQLTTKTISTPTFMGQFNIGFWLNKSKK